MNTRRAEDKDVRPRPKVLGLMDAFAKPMTQDEQAAEAAAARSTCACTSIRAAPAAPLSNTPSHISLSL
jgi:hypothetical protein